MQSNPNLMWAFFRSILIILGIAISLGIGIGIIMHSWISGIIMFIITIIAQFSINAIVMGISDHKNKEAEFLAQQVIREASQRQLPYDLNCAYCNSPNRVGISFTEENVFDCVKCEQPNKVYIQFSTVRITTPLTQKENTSKFIDMDVDTGMSQSTVNEPIKVNEI